MPLDIKGYRVFIASPGGLEEERRAFKETLLAYNEAQAIHDGVIFLPVGWEDTLAGVGRPQSIINEDLRQCDLFVLLLANRWGSNPGGDAKYTSGTEEEFHVALECLRDAGTPMRQIVVLFKAVDPQQLSDPGPNLQRVLEFKKQLESEREHLYQTFDTTRSFEEVLRRHLGAWLRLVKQGDAAPPPTEIPPAESGVAVPSAPEPRAQETEVLEEAARLADAGRRTEAEAVYSRATVGSNDPRAFIAYGRFLIRDGRLEQAVTLLEHARQNARAAGDDSSVADAMLLLGNVLYSRKDLAAAEQMYRKSLEIDERLGRQVGTANAYGNLGNVLYSRGDLAAAEQMYRKSLEIDEQSGRQAGMAKAYANLGNVLYSRGDLEVAEQMYRKSLNIDEGFEQQEGMAAAYGNLGNVFYSRGDLDGAEQMYRKSLEIDERFGRQKEMTAAYANLGNVLYSRGDLDGAEQMYRKSFEINERLGRQEGMAKAYVSLGNVLYARGDLDGSEQMHRRALEINQRLGRPERMASDYDNLGLVLRMRGDRDEAEQMYRQALELYRRVGMPHKVKRMEALLRALSADDDGPDRNAKSAPREH